MRSMRVYGVGERGLDGQKRSVELPRTAEHVREHCHVCSGITVW
jgi:hypothetical protein